jgi:hypothetical protein
MSSTFLVARNDRTLSPSAASLLSGGLLLLRLART